MLQSQGSPIKEKQKKRFFNPLSRRWLVFYCILLSMSGDQVSSSFEMHRPGTKSSLSNKNKLPTDLNNTAEFKLLNDLSII